MITIYNKQGKSLDITIRFAYPDEALLLIALMKKQHGDYYQNPKFYDENYVREGLETERFRFAVAELADGTLGGMAGASTDTLFRGSLIIILLTVNPSQRGFNIGKRLCRFILDSVPSDTFTCVYAHCVTLDTVSQKIHQELGYQMTGLLFNRCIYDTDAENFAGLSLPFKHNHLVACLPQAKRDAGMLYPPPSYSAFIKDVYEPLGVHYALNMERNTKSEVSQTKYEFHQYEKFQYGELFVWEAGPDFTDILEKILAQYGALEQQSFNVFVNLNDPLCPTVCRLLEVHGFFFTGVQPLSGQYEYMILHYSPSIPVPFEQIAVIPEFTRQFAYIQDRYRHRRGNPVLHLTKGNQNDMMEYG